jgi:MerR family transcriptional regulator/heat shock protein HspR
VSDDLFAEDRGVFMISVAAELAGMHPQTLRIYEARGLVAPARSPKRTRLYSQRDVERLRRIHELTTEAGMNLAGVERVLTLEEATQAMQEQVDRLRADMERMKRDMAERLEEVHRSYRRDLVPWQPPGAVVRLQDTQAGAFAISVCQRAGRGRAAPRPGDRRDRGGQA